MILEPIGPEPIGPGKPKVCPVGGARGSRADRSWEAKSLPSWGGVSEPIGPGSSASRSVLPARADLSRSVLGSQKSAQLGGRNRLPADRSCSQPIGSGKPKVCPVVSEPIGPVVSEPIGPSRSVLGSQKSTAPRRSVLGSQKSAQLGVILEPIGPGKPKVCPVGGARGSRADRSWEAKSLPSWGGVSEPIGPGSSASRSVLPARADLSRSVSADRSWEAKSLPSWGGEIGSQPIGPAPSRSVLGSQKSAQLSPSRSVLLSPSRSVRADRSWEAKSLPSWGGEIGVRRRSGVESAASRPSTRRNHTLRLRERQVQYWQTCHRLDRLWWAPRPR